MASSRSWPFDDDDRPSGSVQPLSQADLQAILARLNSDSDLALPGSQANPPPPDPAARPEQIQAIAGQATGMDQLLMRAPGREIHLASKRRAPQQPCGPELAPPRRPLIETAPGTDNHDNGSRYRNS